MVKLKDIITLDNFEKVKPGYIPYIEIGDIDIESKKYKIKSKPSVSGAYKVEPGDILVSTVRPTRGAITMIKDDNIVASGAFARIRVSNTNYLPEYVFYTINTKRFFEYLGINSKGATYPTCSKEAVYDYEIPEIDIEAQKKIVEELKNLDKMLSNRNESIEKLDKLIYAKFEAMFISNQEQFDVSTLGAECILNPKKTELSDVTDDFEVSFIPMPSVSECGDIDASNVKKYSEVKKGFTYFRENDILFAKITPCMENGKGAIARNLKNHVGFGSTEFHVLRCGERIIPEWLFILTKMQSFRKQAELKMTGSAGQKRVPLDFISNYEIYVPPIELQIEFKEFYINAKTSIEDAKTEINILSKMLEQKIINIY